MPSDLGIASNCKYVAVLQNENDLESTNMDETLNSSAEEQSGSDIGYHEMREMDADSTQDVLPSSDVEGVDQKVTFLCHSSKNQRFVMLTRCCLPHRSRCSIREYLLLCIILLLASALTAIVIITQTRGTPVCSTRECVLVAGHIADALDESVDPCDDFYKFACGGWQKKNSLPSGHSSWDNFAKQRLSVDATLKSILERKVTKSNEESAERKARLFYKKCVDLATINQYGVEPMKSLIKKMGGWSIDGNKAWSNFDLNSLLNKLAPFGISPYVSVAVGIDFKNASLHVLEVDEGSMNLSKRKFYLNKTLDDPILKAYLDYMTEACVLFGGEKRHSRKLMEDVMRLEQRIAEIQMPAEQSRHRDIYNKYITIPTLQKVSPAIRWVGRIDAVYSAAFPGNHFDSSARIVTSSEEYLSKITDIISSTSNETLNNYAIWQLVTEFIPALGEDFIKLRAELSKKTSGSDTSCIERWRTCVAEVDGLFGSVLGNLFVEDSFNEESRSMAEEMVREIKDAFKKNLPQTTWLDEETKQKALQKVNAVRDMVGYSDSILNKTKLDEDYSDLVITEDTSYFEMQMKLSKLVIRLNMKSLEKPVDKDKWEMTPPTINAYYTPVKNSIVFPAGILQPPAYSKNYPQSVNFGGIGLVVGHELTHGFDDNGRRYGIDGSLEDWWKEETAHEFEKRAKCMVEQYSNLELNGQRVNGNLTLGENIADNGGVRLAYDAYVQWRRRGNEMKDPLLPSLPYSHDQLFFIASAQLWCSTSTEKYEELSLLNTHSPNRIRVLGFSMNSLEFSESFSCPLGSAMNPAKKCRVW